MKPTYLYIKRHTVTGMKYFGKTVKDLQHMLSYYGSGTKWCNHINYHGKEYVITDWYKLFTDEDELTQYATKFSTENNIVESKEWANLIPEDGIGGAQSDVSKALWEDPEYIAKQAKAALTKYKCDGYSEKRSALTKKQMSDPQQLAIAKETLKKAHETIDHSSKEWTERSLHSPSAKAKAREHSQSAENRTRARERELAKGQDTLSAQGRSRRMAQIQAGREIRFERSIFLVLCR